MPRQRVQECVEVVLPCHVIAAAIHEHVERLSNSVSLGYISCNETNALACRVIGCPPLGFRDRRCGEVDSNHIEPMLREKQRLDAAAATKVDGRSNSRQVPNGKTSLDLRARLSCLPRRGAISIRALH